MEIRIDEIALKKERQTLDIEQNISVLDEIVNSLVNVATTLQTMKDSEINYFFKKLEMRFPPQGIDFRKARALYEINLVKQALRRTGGNQVKAAKLLNLNTTTLNSIIKRHNIAC